MFVMKKIGGSILASLTAFLPVVVFAAPANFGEIGGFISTIMEFINNTLIPLVFALALLMFIWGMFQFFIMGGSDEGKQEQGKSLMLYAIAGFVLMVSVWGIVNMISNGLGFSGNDTIRNIPNVPTDNN
jgi:heme/copper-type cytochrome/quinol oxidase subunit 4